MQFAQRGVWGGWKPHKYWGSLTIREGISWRSKRVLSKSQFPHYTWGYIVECVQVWTTWRVPSLYVRVYRHIYHLRLPVICSLTIREGISDGRRENETGRRFPHYTWGYITRLIRCKPVWRVPSLYVRVYRNFRCRVSVSVCSLTIREGISKRNAKKDAKIAFPHYMWGYIGHFRFFQNPAY